MNKGQSRALHRIKYLAIGNHGYTHEGCLGRFKSAMVRDQILGFCNLLSHSLSEVIAILGRVQYTSGPEILAS